MAGPSSSLLSPCDSKLSVKISAPHSGQRGLLHYLRFTNSHTLILSPWADVTPALYTLSLHPHYAVNNTVYIRKHFQSQRKKCSISLLPSLISTMYHIHHHVRGETASGTSWEMKWSTDVNHLYFYFCFDEAKKKLACNDEQTKRRAPSTD